MIPKIIHYCWFGRNPLPEIALICINSWKKYLPDYEIKEWNEDNYDVRKIPYTSEAYDAKKYAFVSDYARLDILYMYGGLYFDTDVEVLKDLSPITAKGAFVGTEMIGKINPGLGMGCPAKTNIFKIILDTYQNEHFINKDNSLNLKTIVTRASNIFIQNGFKKENTIQTIGDVTVYMIDYFCPKNVQTGVLNITENSYTIHHFDGSWLENWEKDMQNKKQALLTNNNKYVAYILSFFYYIIISMKNLNMISFCKYWYKKIKTKL
jgi:mannosyltransferase OCH1-like enzyme